MLLISCQQEIQRIDLINTPTTAVAIDCEKDRQIDFYLDCDIDSFHFLHQQNQNFQQ